MLGNFDVCHGSGFEKQISTVKLDSIVSSAQSAVFELVQGSSCHVKRSIFSHIWPSMHFRPSISTSFNYFPVLFDWPLPLSLQDKWTIVFPFCKYIILGSHLDLDNAIKIHFNIKKLNLVRQHYRLNFHWYIGWVDK